jgi:hypothetical protein
MGVKVGDVFSFDDDVFEFLPEDSENDLSSDSDFNQTFTFENVVLSVETQLKIANLRAYLYLGL